MMCKNVEFTIENLNSQLLAVIKSIRTSSTSTKYGCIKKDTCMYVQLLPLQFLGALLWGLCRLIEILKLIIFSKNFKETENNILT